MNVEAGTKSDAFLDAAGAAGVLDRASLERLARAREASRDSSVVLAQHLGLISEEDLLELLSTATGLPTTRSSGIDLKTRSVFPGINRSFLRKSRTFPFETPDGQLAVAIADPFDKSAADAISYKLDRPVSRLIASAREIESALAERSSDDVSDAGDARASRADVDALLDRASGAPVVRAINTAIEDACASGASDIHFEPTETDLRIRFRIDGALRDVAPIPYAQKQAATSRLKILAQLDIAETRLPQDGRAKAVVRGRNVDLRISTAPTLFGESVVVRILDRHAVALDLEALGFDAQNRRALESALAAPNGLVFVSGPTGSGKTTTLYAALTAINSPSKKVFTVEDPVEYRLAGVNQVQVNPKIGLTFASALRSLLRQDPDIMMVGEIRDSETAQIAVQAALTGHLVLATIHTNSAAATVTRLLDMGVEDYLIASCAGALIAQRLVGLLCPKCVERGPAPRALFERFGLTADDFPTTGRAVGCPHCRSTGYAGRTTINEVILVTREIADAIGRRASASEIEEAAIRQGMRTMAQDGLIKAAAGLTSVEEVMRAVGN